MGNNFELGKPHYMGKNSNIAQYISLTSIKKIMCKPQKVLSQQTEIQDNFKNLTFWGFYFAQHPCLFHEKWVSVRERNIKLLLESVTYIAITETVTCILQ